MNAADIKVGQIIARRGLGMKNRRAMLVETVTEARPGIFHITGRSVRIADMVQTNRAVSVLHRVGLGEVELLQDVAQAAVTVAKVAKPTAAQARFLTALTEGHPAPQNVVGDWQPINTCKANGWVIAVPADGGRVTWEITPAGREAIGAAPVIIDRSSVNLSTVTTQATERPVADRMTFKRLRGNLHRNRATGMIIRKALTGWQVWAPTRDSMENVFTDHYFTVALRLAKEIAARKLREIDAAHAEAITEDARRPGAAPVASVVAQAIIDGDEDKLSAMLATITGTEPIRARRIGQPVTATLPVAIPYTPDPDPFPGQHSIPHTTDPTAW